MSLPQSSQAEYIIAGHSHIFAMGAPIGYRGEMGLIRAPTADSSKAVYFLMAEWRGNRDKAYWDRLAEESAGRTALILFNGNQHYAEFLLEAEDPFDFYESTVDVIRAVDTWPLVPRRLVKAHFSRSVQSLPSLIASLKSAGASRVAVLGTPAPKADSWRCIDAIRGSEFWQQVAKRRQIDLSDARLTPETVLLKMWVVLQELMSEAAIRSGATFVPVPPETRDSRGFLADRFIRSGDLTHGNDEYGRIVLEYAVNALDTRL